MKAGEMVKRLMFLLSTLAISLKLNVISSILLSQQSSQTSLSPRFSLSLQNECRHVKVKSCQNGLTVIPGHTAADAATELSELLKNYRGSDFVVTFLCLLYMPPCAQTEVLVVENRNEKQGKNSIGLPCLSMCQKAFQEGGERKDGMFPVQCTDLPAEECYDFDDDALTVTYVSKHPEPRLEVISEDSIPSFASIETELNDDSNYDVEIVSFSSSRVPPRRYDIIDLGNPDYFQGWTDVQGSGAANDYCRVVGRDKRRFMSCNLAGSQSQGHEYVSKLGFDPGHPNTWFMRDMDGDGRDDYCRCVGPANSSSEVKCMKAGDKGFYGSTTQRGSQFTFSLPASNGCHNKKINAMFGV